MATGRSARPTVVGWTGSIGLISIDASGPIAADVPQAARLGDAPHLQELHEPTARLDLAPRHIVRPPRRQDWRDRLRAAARGGGAALLVHVAFAAAFFALLSFRDAEIPRQVEIPVEVVTEPAEAKPPAAKAPEPKAPKPDAPKPSEAEKLRQALAAPAPDPNPPAPPQVQPPEPIQPKPAPPSAAPEAPKLVAAPPEPAPAAAQSKEAKPANLAPESDTVDRAVREAKPVAVPRALTTADPKASFAVPMPVVAPKEVPDKPAPPIPAREPSATEKLAAALPMNLDAMPSTFRAVLAGNGAQISAAYKGLVYGQFNRHPEIGERARSRGLKGQVIIAFSIDETGRIVEISVLQTSGEAAVDALGLDLIRASAPFPAPPPGAQRSFTPALAFGE